jgi:hypothetical protein
VAILLPKLRMHFAEFLNANSSVRLSILSSPTCVGLRYGPFVSILRNYFLARRLHALRFAVASLAFIDHISCRICLATSSAFYLDRELPSPGRASPYASFLRNTKRYGNVDPFPIDYAFQPRLRGRLTLGKIYFTLETLGFRRTGISPVFSLLMPAFSLPCRPATFSSYLLPYTECSPTHIH